MTDLTCTYFDEGAALTALPPVEGIFSGLVLGKNQASFNRVEAIVNDCRTGRLISNLALVGVPSSGKTTTAQIIAKHLHRPFFEGSAFNFEGNPSDALHDILENVHGKFPGWVLKTEFLGRQQISTIKPCVVFLDEAHALPTKAQTILLQLMEKPYRANLNGVLLDGSQIMWIFGTTDFSLLQIPLQLRTTAIPFVGYALEEVAQMVHRQHPKFSLEDSLRIAKTGKGHPRQAFKVADFLSVRNLTDGVQAALAHWYEVDDDGLDSFDTSILEILRNNKQTGTPRKIRESQAVVDAAALGQRVGVNTLAKAQAYLDSLKDCAPIAQASLAEKLKFTDHSDLFRRVVYLESLSLVSRTSRGPVAII